MNQNRIPDEENRLSSERILALTKAKIEADTEANGKVFHRIRGKRLLIIAAVLMLTVVSVSAAGVTAVLNHLHAKEVFSRTVPDAVAEQNMDYLQVYDYDPVYSNGYCFELLGSLNANKDGVNIRYTYLLCAVSKADGSPMGEEEIFDFIASPFIEDMDPYDYNVFTATSRGGALFTEDGVGYIILQMNNINIAAKGKDIYVGIYKGMGPLLYSMDKWGNICLREDTDVPASLFKIK